MTIELFETQRAMRARRQIALRHGVVGVLDLGTSSVSCLVLRFENAARARLTEDVPDPQDQLDFRVIGEATTRGRGMEHGEIVAMDEMERAIRTTVQRAQSAAGERIDHVMVCYSGGRPRSYGVHGFATVEEGVVRSYDIGKALALADVPDYRAGEREPIHALPVNFTVDDKTGFQDPRGLVGNRLAVDMHLLTVGARSLQNVIEAVRRCDLELCDIAVSSYTAGRSALVESERELGAAVIEIGAGTTGVAIFLRGQMIFADTIRIGGAHVTSDIAHGLGIDLEKAERLKTLYGGLIPTGADDREMLELPPLHGGGGAERRFASRAELIGIIRPRIEEILEEVRQLLDGAGFEFLPSKQVVLTGGTAQMPGLEELATVRLDAQVRGGTPLRVSGLPYQAIGPDYAALVGLAMHAAAPQDECWDFETPVDANGWHGMRRALRWFRENW